MVETAQKTIEQRWPEHADHTTKSRTRAPRWSTAEGIVCACGDVLGWPDPEHHETLSQYTKRVAAEQVDTASAPGRTQGAFGSYGLKPGAQVDTSTATQPQVLYYQTTDGGLHDEKPESEHVEVGHYSGSADNAPEPGDYPDPEVQEPPAAHDDDPGPGEPEDADVVDWGEPSADEPEPEVIEIVDPHVDAVARAVDEIVKLTAPADEAQTESDIPPWTEDTDDGTDCAVSGCDTSHAPDSEFCDDHGTTTPDFPREEIGRDVVPYAGTPIVPGPDAVGDPLNGRLAPLDPTMPYTPQDVELKIVEIMGQLEKSEVMLRQQVAREHQATHNYTMRYNLAIATSDGRAQDQRTAEAVLATERELFEMTQAKMLTKCLRDSQHNLRSQLSGMQSVARSLSVSLVNALDGRVKPSDLPPEPPVLPWERR